MWAAEKGGTLVAGRCAIIDRDMALTTHSRSTFALRGSGHFAFIVADSAARFVNAE